MLNVIDLKQYVYCPRVFYYQAVLPDVRPITYKMEEGILAHREETGRELRRALLRTYGVAAGTRQFDVRLVSELLGLSGMIDLLIETEHELIPVDYKQAKKGNLHFKVQLMAYARLCELAYTVQKPVKRGFLYFLPERKAREVKFTPALRRKFEGTLAMVHEIAQQEFYPQPTAHRAKCVDCEFRRFCNDVV